MSYEYEENTDAFRSTRRKKQNRRVMINSSLDESQSLLNDEQLIKNLQNKIDTLRQSYFWSQFHNHFHQWINRQSTSIDILSYGLGHISTSMSSQYQYALLKLLEEIFEDRIVHIHLYDPIWTKEEFEFLRKNDTYSKYELRMENNQACQSITRSSLIYIPFCSKPLHNNLLYSNWKKNQLKEILFFGNSFERFSQEVQFDSKKFFYIHQSTSFLTEISLPPFETWTNAFNEQVFTSFDRTIVPPIELLPIKREKNKKLINERIQLEKRTIEQISDDIWSIDLKPSYTNEDEIVVSTVCHTETRT